MQAPDDFNPTPVDPVEIEPGLVRVLCPNPSPMTYRGTNSYLLGQRGLAVIDPGPENDRHLEAILDAIRPGQEITHIFVTHDHPDHFFAMEVLAEAFPDAEIVAHDQLPARVGDREVRGGDRGATGIVRRPELDPPVPPTHRIERRLRNSAEVDRKRVSPQPT